LSNNNLGEIEHQQYLNSISLSIPHPELFQKDDDDDEDSEYEEEPDEDYHSEEGKNYEEVDTDILKEDIQIVPATIPRVQVPMHGFESYTLTLTKDHVHLSWWNMLSCSTCFKFS